jgi:hypothetical protein
MRSADVCSSARWMDKVSAELQNNDNKKETNKRKSFFKKKNSGTETNKNKTKNCKKKN